MSDENSVDFGLPFGLGPEGLFPLETPPEYVPFPGLYQNIRPGNSEDYRQVVESKCYRAVVCRHGCSFHGFGTSMTCAIMNAHYECHKTLHAGRRGLLLPSDDCFVCQLELQGRVRITDANSQVFVEEISLFPPGDAYYWNGQLLTEAQRPSAAGVTPQKEAQEPIVPPKPRKLTRKNKKLDLLSIN